MSASLIRFVSLVLQKPQASGRISIQMYVRKKREEELGENQIH